MARDPTVTYRNAAITRGDKSSSATAGMATCSSSSSREGGAVSRHDKNHITSGLLVEYSIADIPLTVVNLLFIHYVCTSDFPPYLLLLCNFTPLCGQHVADSVRGFKRECAVCDGRIQLHWLPRDQLETGRHLPVWTFCTHLTPPQD